MKTLDRLRERDVDAGLVAEGTFSPILNWFRLQVPKPGCRYRPVDLVCRLSGAPLDPSLFTGCLNDKYAGIHGL